MRRLYDGDAEGRTADEYRRERDEGWFTETAPQHRASIWWRMRAGRKTKPAWR